MLGTIMCYGPVVDWNMKAGHPYNEYALVFVCIFYFICICDVKVLKVYFVNCQFCNLHILLQGQFVLSFTHLVPHSKL